MKRTLLLICTLLCANVLLAQGFWEGDLYYNITGGQNVYVYYCNQSATSVNIPSSVTHAWEHYDEEEDEIVTDSIVTYNVTSIGQSAFAYCSSLTSVTIPNSVTSIGAWAFEGCYSLTSVTIPNSVTSIEYGAFMDCHSLNSVTIPNSVTYIGEWAFECCSSLTSVSIPNSVSYIEFGVFDSCTNLISVTIPNSVISIGEQAFNDCYSLTSVTIGNSVTSIGDHAFRDCSSLTSVTIPNSVISIGNSAFYDCGSLTSVTIGNSVTSIGDYAFRGCSSLTSIDIPNSVTSIGDYAFAVCNTLSSVTLGNSITSIGYATFYDCSSLTSVTIPNSVTSIDDWAFGNCSSLTSVAITNSVTSIGNSVFDSCVNLTSVNIPISVTSIGEQAFLDCSSLTSITIPNSVTSIGNRAFRNCTSLTSVTIGNSITSIGDYAFGNCSSLTSVDIPNSVTSIGGAAFHYCTGLESINLSDNITSIGRNCFDSCINLTTVNIPTSLSVIDTSLFKHCTSLTSITIPENITNVKVYAFIYCSSLTSIDIPNSVTSIGKSAFAYCNNLTSVNIGNSVTSIEYGAFGECNSLSSVTCLANTPPSLGDLSFYNTPSNKILNVNCGLKDDYILSWGNAFDSNNIFEMYQYNVVATVNNEEFGSVAVENNCSTATLSATANEGYLFANWNDGNTENPRVVSLTSDTSFVANFITAIVNTDITATICQGQTYTENGFNVSEAGVYTQTLTAINGADSIVTLTLNVNPIFNIELTATICEGQIYTENNFNISEAGVYTQTLQTINGCDSIVTLTLNVNPIFNTELTATICQGQVYNEQGFNVSEAGVYTQTLTSVNGCDSIVTLTLNVNPIFNTELSATICEGQVYTENGFNVSEAGVYTQNLTSVNGCDSIVTLTLNVNPIFDTTINATINAGETYAEFGFNESEAGTYTQSLTTEFGCDSTITLILSVNSSLSDAEIEEISFYPNPTDSKVIFSQMIEKVEVIDLTGKVIFTFRNENEINLESLPAGAYYLRLTNNDKAVLRKLIKE